MGWGNMTAIAVSLILWLNSSDAHSLHRDSLATIAHRSPPTEPPGTFVYRGDKRAPATLRSQGGFQPRGQDYYSYPASFSSHRHYHGGHWGWDPRPGANSNFTTAFVSVSPHRSTAEEYHGWLYTIHGTPNMVRYNEEEHLALGGIHWGQVIEYSSMRRNAAGQYERSPPTHNADYRGDLYGEFNTTDHLPLGLGAQIDLPGELGGSDSESNSDSEARTQQQEIQEADEENDGAYRRAQEAAKKFMDQVGRSVGWNGRFPLTFQNYAPDSHLPATDYESEPEEEAPDFDFPILHSPFGSMAEDMECPEQDGAWGGDTDITPQLLRFINETPPDLLTDDMDCTMLFEYLHNDGLSLLFKRATSHGNQCVKKRACRRVKHLIKLSRPTETETQVEKPPLSQSTSISSETGSQWTEKPSPSSHPREKNTMPQEFDMLKVRCELGWLGGGTSDVVSLSFSPALPSTTLFTGGSRGAVYTVNINVQKVFKRKIPLNKLEQIILLQQKRGLLSPWHLKGITLEMGDSKSGVTFLYTEYSDVDEWVNEPWGKIARNRKFLLPPQHAWSRPIDGSKWHRVDNSGGTPGNVYDESKKGASAGPAGPDNSKKSVFKEGICISESSNPCLRLPKSDGVQGIRKCRLDQSQQCDDAQSALPSPSTASVQAAQFPSTMPDLTAIIPDEQLREQFLEDITHRPGAVFDNLVRGILPRASCQYILESIRLGKKPSTVKIPVDYREGHIRFNNNRLVNYCTSACKQTGTGSGAELCGSQLGPGKGLEPNAGPVIPDFSCKTRTDCASSFKKFTFNRLKFSLTLEESSFFSWHTTDDLYLQLGDKANDVLALHPGQADVNQSSVDLQAAFGRHEVSLSELNKVYIKQQHGHYFYLTNPKRYMFNLLGLTIDIGNDNSNFSLLNKKYNTINQWYGNRFHEGMRSTAWEGVLDLETWHPVGGHFDSLNVFLNISESLFAGTDDSITFQFGDKLYRQRIFDAAERGSHFDVNVDIESHFGKSQVDMGMLDQLALIDEAQRGFFSGFEGSFFLQVHHVELGMKLRTKVINIKSDLRKDGTAWRGMLKPGDWSIMDGQLYFQDVFQG